MSSRHHTLTGDNAPAMPTAATWSGFSLPAEAHSRVRVDGTFFARGGQRLRIRGVTYGPFAPNAAGQPFPAPDQVCADLVQMRAIGINALRTYHVPPPWLLEIAGEQGLSLLVDVPWPKHLCFLDSRQSQQEAWKAVRSAACLGSQHPCVLGYSIGNEIPANIVRWHGARRVERFLAELCDVARQADPQGLVTYANYPSTEYLELPFLDFATFNVYLHDPETFRRYLFRLQNRVGVRPLLLGEIGMDTLRHTEAEQAAFLAGHLCEVTRMGLAGAFVFAWTDDWHTGGYQIEDWAFGVTRADRAPKPSFYALGDLFRQAPTDLLPTTPRVSVVVCSYNGGRTLEQCLQSLLTLDYPDYEVILVDDGSTDATPAIAARFPEVRTIHQENQGLSVARNVGLQAATGAIVAYTDSDCYADPDWLTHLVYQLERSGADAVGGPNLTPEDGWLAACVAAAPGQPTHVLESDQVAEHIPGCNMAFRREALEAIHGFNPKYRKAGDDVDVCWRLQQAGMWITFAPGAFVWHHRRQCPRAYLRQQAGYGEAEGLLWFDHPARFNSRGEGRWQGRLYGASLAGLRLTAGAIYRGTFASGLFQTLYQPEPAHWAMLPTTLEWVLSAILIGLTGVFWLPAAFLSALMLTLTLGIAALQAGQAPLASPYGGLRARVMVGCLCLAQPLVRSWWRHRTRLFPPNASHLALPGGVDRVLRMPLTGIRTVTYWDEAWQERTELLDRMVGHLAARHWPAKVDAGWSDYDMEIYSHLWTALQVCTAQEDHGSGKRLIRLRYRLRPSEYTKGILGLALASALLALGFQALPAGLLSGVLLAYAAFTWWRGARLSSHAIAAFHAEASALAWVRCDTSDTPPEQTSAPVPYTEELHGG